VIERDIVSPQQHAPSGALAVVVLMLQNTSERWINMLAQLRRLLLLTGAVLLCASAVFAQVTTLEGSVKDENGQPLKGAVIKLERTDIKGHYQVKSDKKGHWFYTGLPLGTYNITCEVDGKVVDTVNGVKSKYGDSTIVDFDAGRMKQQQAAAQQAAETGQLTQEQTRGMSAEQKAALEKQVKERSEAMKKNKALNDEFNAGKTAMEAKDYAAAEQHFQKAGELDPNQVAVWSALGDTQYALAKTQPATQNKATYEKAAEAYKKALALKADDAALYNQLGNVYGAEGKVAEATEALTKAAQLDPQMAAKAYYNLGANLVNTGKSDEAADFFKKAIEADPNYADAHYQYGICLMAKAQVDASGKITPPEGTADQFQKYLELKPDGPFAQSSKDMLTQLGAKVDTNYKAPGADKSGSRKKK
jgi:tetratricopeptide (TPR) repeat protein